MESSEKDYLREIKYKIIDIVFVIGSFGALI
jgi:hypothetical protein